MLKWFLALLFVILDLGQSDLCIGVGTMDNNMALKEDWLFRFIQKHCFSNQLQTKDYVLKMSKLPY